DLALDPKPRLVQLEHVLDDRQAEPGAAAFAGTAGGDAVEPLGEPRQVFRGDAATGVADRQHRSVAVAREANPDGTPVQRVAVVGADEVGERAAQFSWRAEQVRAGLVHDVDGVPALAERAGLAAQAGEHRRHRYFFLLADAILRLELRQREQVLDQPGHALRLVL